jgi:hypothetical protein
MEDAFTLHHYFVYSDTPLLEYCITYSSTVLSHHFYKYLLVQILLLVILVATTVAVVLLLLLELASRLVHVAS